MRKLFQFRLLVLCIMLSTGVACSSLGQKAQQDDTGDTAVEVDEGAAAGEDSQSGASAEDADADADLAADEDEEKKPKRKTDISRDMFFKLLVAEMSARAGDSDTAIAAYLDAARETGDVEAAAMAAKIANSARNVPKMLEAVQLWVELDDKSPTAYQAYASTLLQLNQPAHAVEQYNKMIALMPKRQARAYQIISDRLLHQPDFEIGKAVMEQIVEKHKDSPDAHFSYASLLFLLAKFDQAVVEIDKALQIRQEWSRAILLRARALALGKKRKQAVEYLGQMAERFPKNIDIGFGYARVLAEEERREEALEHIEKLMKLAPRNAELVFNAAVLSLQLEKIKKAEAYFKRELKFGKHLQFSNFYLGQIAEERKDYKAAINRYSTVKYGEWYFRSQVRVVRILAETGDLKKAREYIRSIRTEGGKQELQLQLLEGRLLSEAKLYKEAKAHYTDLLKQSPNETSILYERGIVEEKLGELDAAEKDFQEILKNEPKNAQVLNALGYTLADRTQRYQEALSYIKRAYELEPNDAAVMDSMGWVQYRLGNYNDAIEHLQKANEMEEDPEIAAHFGEVLWVIGDKEKAKKIWTESLKKNPDHPILLKVYKKFTQ